MTYELAIGDRTYSSWSLRGWLLFEKFDLPVQITTAHLYLPEFKELLKGFAPSKTVPCARFDGDVIFDSYAMAEELHERNPDAAMWPQNPAARMFARSITAEMHSGFTALRGACPMNLRLAYEDYVPDDGTVADCKRIEELWEIARSDFGASGPWLFGEYSIADVFYAPVAMRFATYGLPRGDVAQAYIDTHLNDPSFRKWRAMGAAENYVQEVYDLDLNTKAWPGPTPLKTALADSPAENDKCPFSGKPTTHYVSVEGRTFGMCNPFCRDKVLSDPEAWPAFMALMG